jgi:hypothetical protein
MEYPVQQLLELACAAQRQNNEYLKENIPVLGLENRIIGYKFSNKLLMIFAVQPSVWNEGVPHPPTLTVNDADQQLTKEIRSYYRRLMFSVMANPDNTFQQEIMSLLNKETIPASKFGFVACLPSVHNRDRRNNDMGKRLRECDNLYLAPKGKVVSNLEADVVDCSRSKNFDAYNVTAIIDNKVVSWFSKQQINLSICRIKSAKVKEHQQQWISKKSETRLNYVKVIK